MSEKEILKKLNEIIADITEKSKTEYHESTAWSDIPNFDSVRKIMLLAEAEDSFGITFPTDRFADIKTIGEIVELIKNGGR
ncbi:hypothetical protein AGMMS49975_00260 [Clostridia bacterium]|nr:hypothetical protein AGMMS49975_00260 [Clostridia bacterium]